MHIEIGHNWSTNKTGIMFFGIRYCDNAGDREILELNWELRIKNGVFYYKLFTGL